jgi:hypothetical protein
VDNATLPLQVPAEKLEVASEVDEMVEKSMDILDVTGAMVVDDMLPSETVHV